jgi:SMC interacting uncharacterized protein involved in chromosome segregation
MGVGMTREEYEDEQREHREEIEKLEAEIERLRDENERYKVVMASRRLTNFMELMS